MKPASAPPASFSIHRYGIRKTARGQFSFLPVTNSGGRTTNSGIFAPSGCGCAMLSPEKEECRPPMTAQGRGKDNFYELALEEEKSSPLRRPPNSTGKRTPTRSCGESSTSWQSSIRRCGRASTVKSSCRCSGSGGWTSTPSSWICCCFCGRKRIKCCSSGRRSGRRTSHSLRPARSAAVGGNGRSLCGGTR